MLRWHWLIRRALMKSDEDLIIERLNNKAIKYFRYIDEYNRGNHSHMNDLLFCVHEIVDINREKQTFKAFNKDDYDPLLIEYPFTFLLSNDVELLDTSTLDKHFTLKAKENERLNEIYRKKLKEEMAKKNNDKDDNFARLKPPLKRGTEVTLINVPRAWIDFTKTGDVFYVDDVTLIDNELIYALLVVAPRGKRGIYKFHTDLKFHSNHLKAK